MILNLNSQLTELVHMPISRINLFDVINMVLIHQALAVIVLTLAFQQT